ncbi:MAG: DEAD/DEAH box helicase family protein [Thermodesulfobacteriota bacterium]
MLVSQFKDIDGLSGEDFEVFVRDLLEASGWTDTTITKPGKEYKHGDGGVDIFASKSGRRFAIEVKKRNIQARVDISALNQLVTGAELAKVQNKILITNSYFTSEVKVRGLRLGVDLVDRDGLQDLWVKKHSEIGRDIKPRGYQSQIVEESLEKYRGGKNKLLIEMATGLGKTYTVAFLIRELARISGKTPKVIFIAHQIEILLQSVTAFKNILGVGSYSFSACFAGSVPEPTDFVFASFDTVYSQIDNIQKEAFDYVVIDEAHHTPARTYSRVVEYFSPKLLIGLTATPYRMDNKSVIDFFGGTDGHVGKYDLSWALKHKKLAFPKYLVLLDDLDQSKIDQLEDGLSISDIDKRLFLHKKDEEVVNIIEDTVKQKKIKNLKGIVFCRNISHAMHLLGFFELHAATHVHSKMSDNERRENIRKFREGDFKYILVCDLFNEGIDIPEANLLVFMRYTGSRVIWLQQLGRGLRKTPNKEFVHVLDFVGSLERLDEIKQLSQSVQNTRLDKNNLEDTQELRDRKEIIHDGTLKVEYSKSAAKVLELIKNLQYRLQRRGNLIEQLRRYRKDTGIVPSIRQLEGVLEDVSFDQVATLFDSYFGYLTATFGDDFNKEEMKARISGYASKFIEDHKIKPSEKAMSLSFQFEALPEFTEMEVRDLLSELEIPIPEISQNKEKDSIETKSMVDISKEKLLFKYKETILSRKDLRILTSSQRKEIEKCFVSVSVFLRKLNDMRSKS